MIGVSDLLNNGFEWMQDWFDYNYYAKSPELNPQGPEEPLQREEGNTLRIWRFKSVRGGLANFVVDSANARFGFPLEYPAELVNLTARCVVNQGSINHE